MSNAERVRSLQDRGVCIPAPEQVWIAPEVALDAIMAGAVLHPGTRVEGARTLIAQGAEVGSSGPATARNCALGPQSKLGSGLFEGAVLLDGASFGPCCHAREGTLLEEGASAAHAVGTKQTILLPFATLGSNINFCDALLAGGSSAQDHSEIGSGFIHFNFTPHGPGGDKATPSLLGDVPRGVWLREKRIFLGGAGGVVGPAQIGYGTVLAAGSVWRRDRGEDLLALAERLPERELAFNPAHQSRPREKLMANARYIGNLCALRAFHLGVRMPLLRDDVARTGVVAAACALLEASIGERMKQLERWAVGLAEQGEPGRARAALRTLQAQLADTAAPAPPLAMTQALSSGARSSVDGPVIGWLRSAPETAMAAGREWLAAIVESRVAAVRRATE